MRARRALLYMPGDEMKKIVKATTLGVDSICMDMEDGVALNRKQIARSTIVEALKALDFGQSERLARINQVDSNLASLDLEAVLPAHPDGIVVPKVENGEQLRWVSQQVDGYEKKYNWQTRSIYMIAIIETARAIVNLQEIATASPRLEALIFGAEDLAGEIGAVRTWEAWEVFYARSAVVTYAAAFQLQAIDMVNLDFQDLDRLKEECIRGMQMGFVGKQVIHPNQVNPVQDAFTPGEEAIHQAKRIIDEFQEHQKVGVGAFSMDGKLVDAPVVKIAEQVLARARAAGKI